MSKLPTAEEFAKQHHPMKTYPADWNVMIEFAKLHVEAALKVASEKIEYVNIGEKHFTDLNSILYAYPLENIK